MRTIAELIMRGRVQAGAVALLGTLLPFITPAAIALVTLRKGAFEGTLVLLIGLLPTILTFGANTDHQALVFLSTVISLIAVYISALVLRQTVFWSSTLITLLLVSILPLLLVTQLAPHALGHLVDSLNVALQTQATAADVENPVPAINGIALAGILAVVIIINGICSLFLGRWWQSLLYNPGGFRNEFRQFRLESITAAVCLTLSLYFLVQDDTYLTWSFVFALPLMLVSVAIVHTMVSSLKNARQCLIIFYVTLIVLVILQLANYVQIVLMGVGFLDHWLNFRSRKAQIS